MMAMGLVALVANTVCLLLISKHCDGEVHMCASWIFSKNDVIANVGVILAGALVAVTASRIPDLVIGIAVALDLYWLAVGVTALILFITWVLDYIVKQVRQRMKKL